MHALVNGVPQAVEQNHVQQAVVGEGEVGIARPDRGSESSTLLERGLRRRAGRTERIESPLGGVGGVVVDRVQQMRDPAEVGTDVAERLLVARDLGQDRRSGEDLCGGGSRRFWLNYI